MEQHARHDYRRLVSRFRAARRAWKRAAMLSGVVVVVIEAIGAITLAVLADLLFAPSSEGRIAIGTVALAIVGFFALRHVVRPLLRRITYKQLALYLEQRNPDFEGALIAAAEFGPDHSFQGRQAEIVDAILREAVTRVEKFDLRRAIDLGRFRKYGLVAMALVAAYLAMGLALPEAVGHRLARVVTPWKLTQEEEAAQTLAAARARPITFGLSRGDAELLRGSSFELEAVLSRGPVEPVVFHFRSLIAAVSDSAWKVLPMKELEKLNTYQAVLPDVNEEFEFFVSSGPFKSDAHRVDVYDPLVIKGLEIATRMPDYMKLPDRVETAETADVTAPVGSTVSLTFLTNRPLRGGELLWEKGSPSQGTVAAAKNMTLTAGFTVSETTTFRWRINDVNSQVVESPAPAAVTALVDQPPTIKLLKPGPEFTGNPLSEIALLAEVGDDFGLAGGEMVVARTLDGKVKEQRMPLVFDADPATEAVTRGNAHAVLMLENLSPPVTPGEAITCYLEVRDRKGQTADSDLTVITVTPFETWAYLAPPHAMHPHELFFIEPVIAATWELHRTRSHIAPKDYDQQAESIAASMVDPKTKQLHPYFNPEHVFGEQLEHGKKAMELIQQAHDALARHDTTAAMPLLQLALTELKLAGYTEMAHVMPPPPNQQNAGELQKELKQMTALMQKPEASQSAKQTQTEKDSAAEAATAEALKKAQAEVVEQIKQAASKPEAERHTAPMATKESELGRQAQQLAGSVKNSEAGNREKAEAAKELTGAAQSLHEAAAALKAKNLPQALSKAESAHQQLTAASEKLNANSHDRVNQFLSDALAAAAELHRKQESLLKQSQAAPKGNQAKELGRQQVQLLSGVKNLQETLGDLQKVAAAGTLKPETAQHVDQAVQAIKRSRLTQKMTSAAVELAAANAKGAETHQAKAVAALGAIQEELLAANNAVGTDLTTALAQAKRQAQTLKNDLDKMAGKKAERKELAEKAADDADRLARQLGVRDFAKGDEEFKKDIHTVQDKAKDRDRLAKQLEKKPDEPEAFSRVAQRVTDRLEAAYQANLEAKRLFAAQREECPPQYRRFVNQYFEALSKQEK